MVARKPQDVASYWFRGADWELFGSNIRRGATKQVNDLKT